MNARQTVVLGVVALALSGGLVVAVGGFVGTGPSQGDTVPATTTPGQGTDDPQTTQPTTSEPVEEPRLQYSGDAISLETAREQVVRGQVDLPEGTEVTMRMRSTDSENPFLLTSSATVGDDGSIAATFDLAGLDGNSTANLTVRHDGSTLVAAPVAVSYVESAAPDEAESAATVQYEGDRLTLEPQDDQEIRATTDLDAGTDLTVRVVSTGSGQPFIRSLTATVDEDGRVVTSVDLSSIEAGTEFEVRLVHEDETLATVPGVVGADGNETTAEFVHATGEVGA